MKTLKDFEGIKITSLAHGRELKEFADQKGKDLLNYARENELTNAQYAEVEEQRWQWRQVSSDLFKQIDKMFRLQRKVK